MQQNSTYLYHVQESLDGGTPANGVARRGQAQGCPPSVVFDRDVVADILRASGDVFAGDRYQQCCEGGRGWVGTCVDCGTQVYHPSSCELRICPRCAGRRSKELTMELSQVVKELVSKAPWPYSLKHITLATNICLLDYLEYDAGTKTLNVGRLAYLGEIVRVLRVNVRLMFQERFKGSKLLGGGIGVEFGPGGLMLHFHVLALCPYYPQKELSDDWKRYAGEFSPEGIVYIQKAKGGNRGTEDIDKVVGYVSKYVTKPIGKKDREAASTGHVSRVQEWVSQYGQEPVIAAVHFVFKGLRRFQTFGSFHGVDLEPDEPEVCPDCGGRLIWRPELEVLRAEMMGVDVLKLLGADNLSSSANTDPPKMMQDSLFGS